MARLAQPKPQRTKGNRNGQGSVYQRKRDGLWCAAVTLEDGRRKVFYCHTQKEADDKLLEARGTKKAGLPFVPERLTVGQWLTYWLREIAPVEAGPKTLEGYELNVRLHLTPPLGKIPLKQLRPEQIERMMREMRAAGKSPRTIQSAHATLRNAIAQAMRREYAVRNVATMVSPPKQTRSKIPPPRIEDALALLAAVQGHHMGTVIFVALALGLRRGEVLGLRWEDVDLERRTLTVRNTVQRVQGFGLRVKPDPKSEYSERTVSMPQVIVDALAVHRERQVTLREAANGRWQGPDYFGGRMTGFVFTSTIGTVIEPRSVNRYYDAAVKRAGIPKQRFHDLRHNFAGLLLVQGVAPRVVQEMMGHSTIAITMNRYTHVPDALQRDAADRLDALLSGTQRV